MSDSSKLLHVLDGINKVNLDTELVKMAIEQLSQPLGTRQQDRIALLLDLFLDSWQRQRDEMTGLVRHAMNLDRETRNGKVKPETETETEVSGPETRN